jgi:endonuclease/exonuclease/phosphatase family metal-dependent hydrolase
MGKWENEEMGKLNFMITLRTIVLRTLFLALLSLSLELFGQTVGTYNIRYANPADGADIWENRRDSLSKAIMDFHPDFLGLQEALLSQLQYLDSTLIGYSRYGVGREDGVNKGEFAPIYFDSKKYKIVSGKTIWLSDSIDHPNKGWDAACERIATIVVFKGAKEEDTYCVVNSHWDHVGQEARRNSAKLILEQIQPYLDRNMKVIVMGDFNATPDNEAIKLLKEKLVDSCPASLEGFGTFNGFKLFPIDEPRIDYIFHSQNLKTRKYRVLSPKSNKRQASDHYFVQAEL